MKLYYFPLSTYSQKVLIALYEKEVDFTPQLVDLQSDAGRNEYRKIYPLGKVPLLVREDGWKIPESSIIIEYLDTHFDTGTRLLPTDAEDARQVRFRDRMLDLYLNDSVVTLWFESWKPAGEQDQAAIEKSRFRVGVMYEFMAKDLAQKEWIAGDSFSMADCAAAPVLVYAQQVAPFTEHTNIRQYWQRLSHRPSFQRVLKDAAPYLEQTKAVNA